MNRREAIKNVALFMGGTLTTSYFTTFLAGCAPETTSAGDWSPAFLDAKEANLVAAAADRILPTTDTPGAKDAQIEQFVDALLKDCAEAADQKNFRDGLAAFDAACKNDFGKNFVDLPDADKDAALKKAAADGAVARKNGKFSFFHSIKELTLYGFFNSEPGMTKVRQYVAVPGSYQGCITFQEAGGKIWAT